MRKTEKANIPSNEEIIKMIPSKAVREYLQKIGHEFSLCEEAALIYQNPLLRQDESLDALNKIAKTLRLPENDSKQFSTYRNCIDGNPDSGEKITATELATQIESHIKSDMEMEIDLFRNTLEGIYEVDCSVKNESLRSQPYDTFSCPAFSSIEKAIDYVMTGENNKLLDFIVTLRKIDEGDKYVSGTFNGKGELLRVDSSFMGTQAFDSDNCLDNFYSEIPYPFNDGDIVQDLSSGRIGVVNHLGGEKDGKLKNICKRYRDSSDIIVPVDCLDDDGNFVYEPFYTPCVDYATRLDESKNDGEFLYEASLLVQGKGSLEYFCNLVKKQNLR
ncbi:MAG: hypothetical protein K5873_03940 [Treponema sp.]|nr:hypothetical protein [Treponema sp.]